MNKHIFQAGVFCAKREKDEDEALLDMDEYHI